ncbi:MAG TPA: IS1595 family transposase [Pyrinomonadaceae bacterium]|jgi:transposase-like protein
MAKTKKQKQDVDLTTLMSKFSDEEACRTYLEHLRWPDGVKCLRCQSEKISRVYDRGLFACDACGYQGSVKVGTIFHDSHLPLTKWFLAVYLMCEAKKGVSALQLKRTLGVAYKTAWYLCHRIRAAVADADTSQLTGIVECDETYIGGKAKNMHKSERERRIQGRGPVGKAMVLGAIQRGGGVRLTVEKRNDRATLHKFTKAAIADDAECIMTDTWPAYEGIADENTRHETVNHSADEYVRGECHTNNMENVWSLFKRSIVGAYHQVSEKHLDRYLDEFTFRFENRNNPYLFRDTLLRLIAAPNLEYKELTKAEAA